MTLSISNLNSASKLSIEIAQKLAKEQSHATFGTPHLLMALLNSRVGITSFITSMEKDLSYLKSWAQYRIDEYKTKGLPVDEPEADDDVKKTIDVSSTFKLMYNRAHIDPLCILSAITRPGVAFPKGQIGSLKLTEEELVQAVLSDTSIQAAVADGNGSSTGAASGSAGTHSASNTKAFLNFCIDKIALAQQGKIDPIFGRDVEIGKMENILCRRTKPNVIITGEPGVGKTALVDGFALQIAEGNVSEYFKDAKLYQLDVGALMAGASYRGEVEDRLKKIMTEIKRIPKVILFIDEIHIILDKDSGANGVANLIKPELARGEINVIGATTNKEYRLHVEKDPAFVRRFEVLNVEEPDIPAAVKMVKGLKNLFEEHHKYQLPDDVLESIVKLAKRYFPTRRLPDSAIDLMDRTMSSFRILEDNLKARIEKVDQALSNLKDTDAAKVWANFWDEASKTLTSLAFQNVDQDQPNEFAETTEWKDYVNAVLKTIRSSAATKRTEIGTDEVAAVVADSTGIPVGKTGGDEQQKLLEFDKAIKSKVIGQDLAADIISKAIKRSRSGLKEKDKPIGSFFLVGPTGTGKTELAKAITEELFNTRDALIRFDMSEYMEPHSVSMLKGSPPGYVGFENGGLLVNKIRQQPYAVVLFDEVEKAHPDVFKLFLQILDEGYMHDTLDKVGKFEDALILFTSNAEAEWVVEQFEKGEVPEEAELKDRMLAARHFKPEFLNRLDAVIPFAPLSKEDLVKILELQLKSFRKLLKERNITLELSEAAANFLVDKGYSPAFGARPLKRVIDTYLADNISEQIIAGEVKNGQTLKVDLEQDSLKFSAQ